MNATRAIDLEDTDGLLAADREGLLRAASTAGAQVRAVAAARDEGALESLRADGRPRSVIWVAVASSTSRLKPRTPPYALSGSPS